MQKKNQKRSIFLGLIFVLLIAIIAIPLYLWKNANPKPPTTTSSAPIPLAQTQSEFVTRSGSQLLLHGQPFRFAGPNIYWLGLDTDEHGVIYPSHFRVDDALTTARTMGATVVRAHSLGISVGCALCVEPTPGTFNDTALQHIDYAIQAAHTHHLRLIIPLVDNWRYYHGGKHTFTEWRNVGAETLFFSDKTVIADFEQYVAHLLNHVNSYTGIAYKDDPTILAWETGNEISPPASWTKTIADFIKSTDKHHLVMDGSQTVNAAAMKLSSVDMFTQHFYPLSTSLLEADAQVAAYQKKVFVVGEYDWTGTRGGDELSSFLPIIEQNPNISGDLYWSLFSHTDTYGYTQHSDGYTLHYPGDTADQRTRVQALQAHAYKLSKQTTQPLPAPGAPQITALTDHKISWRGAAISYKYTVERSTTGTNGPWKVICDQCATDNDTPWTDTTTPKGTVWYRIKGYNLAGVAGPYSAVASSQPTRP
ncbi:glycoside hydrolase family 2 TIM barrel-domain containing protein [Dictyobacter kobayashii]|uniref:mannan endo-1,4-beta-mannosidase n=1 Tax=Dictyobacter kobayashii TaxID=2014872 RepID=A0A402AW40_9CHLR|nr:glycoside hydrolase family 2 TIM barrel-domain containing protein [Dictyobacter kobayashii]GCE23342.1 hypothetical protein KDK_71420 [Dictyobacter kobayashii]